MAETPQEYTERILGYVEGKDALRIQRGTADQLKKLTRGLSAKQLNYRPEPGKWSITEILAHLADVEIVVGWRMRLILGSNGTPILGFDQDSWASTLQYSKQDPKWCLEVFRVLRAHNLAMLKRLPKPLWDNYGMHSERGQETIAHIVRMLAGHDTNHLKQISALKQQMKASRKK